MAYSRRDVRDYSTVMDKELYDNLQDGVEQALEAVDNINNIINNQVAKATVEE